MRRLLSFALVGGLAWWFFGRRQEPARPSATIGYADGSSVLLEPGSPELDRLLLIAGEAATE